MAICFRAGTYVLHVKVWGSKKTELPLAIFTEGYSKYLCKYACLTVLWHSGGPAWDSKIDKGNRKTGCAALRVVNSLDPLGKVFSAQVWQTGQPQSARHYAAGYGRRKSRIATIVQQHVVGYRLRQHKCFFDVANAFYSPYHDCIDEAMFTCVHDDDIGLVKQRYRDTAVCIEARDGWVCVRPKKPGAGRHLCASLERAGIAQNKEKQKHVPRFSGEGAQQQYKNILQFQTFPGRKLMRGRACRKEVAMDGSIRYVTCTSTQAWKYLRLAPCAIELRVHVYDGLSPRCDSRNCMILHANVLAALLRHVSTRP